MNIQAYVIQNEMFYYFQCYMRALFDYNPSEDTLLPCKEIGLEFKKGDILQVSCFVNFQYNHNLFQLLYIYKKKIKR